MWFMTRWFRLLIGRRCDLGGMPYGFLFIWYPEVKGQGLFAQITGAREFGFWFRNPFKAWHYEETPALVQVRDRWFGAR